LYSRTIPIAIGKSSLEAFRDLPILFVEDFRRITREFLAQEYERIRALKWNWPKLFLPWWRDRILEQSEKLRKGGAQLLPRKVFFRDIAGTQFAELKRRVLRKA
jgi:hypothetical protein